MIDYGTKRFLVYFTVMVPEDEGVKFKFIDPPTIPAENVPIATPELRVPYSVIYELVPSCRIKILEL
jgi:hypothetical protein